MTQGLVAGQRFSMAVLLAGVFLLACAAVTGCPNSRREGYPSMDELIAQRDTAMKLLREERESVKAHQDRLEACTLNEFQIATLQRQGLADPLTEIPADLASHSELIPGNRVPRPWKYYFREELVRILTTKWVLAGFEDGHGSGAMLLEYTVGDSGRIGWKPLAWMNDE